MRSIFGRARVTQSVAPSASRGGIARLGHQRQPGRPPGGVAAVEHLGARPRRCRSQAATPSLRAWPSAQITTAGAPGEGRRPGRRPPRRRRRRAPGTSRGSAAASSSVAHVDQRRGVGPAEQAEELVGRKAVGGRHGGVLARRGGWTRCSGRSLMGRSRSPCGDGVLQARDLVKPSARRSFRRRTGYRRNRRRLKGAPASSRVEPAEGRVVQGESTMLPDDPREPRFRYPEELQVEACPAPQAPMLWPSILIVLLRRRPAGHGDRRWRVARRNPART